MWIKRTELAQPKAIALSRRDRESLDFARFFGRGNNEHGPIPGMRYALLLRIASEICNRPIRELTEIKSRSEAKRIRERIRLEKYGRE
jgi:hypothetical protein